MAYKHQLTDKEKDAYQKYFGKDIRDCVNNNIKMKKKIEFEFLFSVSTKSYRTTLCNPCWCFD